MNLVHELTIPYQNRKYSETTLSVMPVFYLLVPNLYILCCFPQIPVSAPQTVCLLLPCRASRGSTETCVDGLHAAAHVPASPPGPRAVMPSEWASVCGPPQPLVCTARRCPDTWGPQMRNVWREGREASETFIKRKCLGFERPVCQAERSGAAIKWRAGSRQAPHLIFLLGAQVDKLAALFAAFFSLSPLYRKNC